MGRVQIISHLVHSDKYTILESDGTKTVVRDGYAGMIIEQRRADGSKGIYRTYEDQGRSLYPYLMRFLISIRQPLPKIQGPTVEGNDTFVNSAETYVEYAITQPFPVSYEDAGFSHEKQNTIRAIFHPVSKTPGLLISESKIDPVFISSGVARAILQVLPRIYPRYPSYKIMENRFRRAVKEGIVKKIVFEKKVPIFLQHTEHIPMRVRKGFREVEKRYNRIYKRRR